MSRTINTTEELIAYMSEAENRLARRLPNENGIHVCVEFPNEKAIPYPKEGPKRRKKPERLTSDFWVIMVKQKNGSEHYIQKLTPGYLHFAYTSEYAKQFKSHPAAAKWASDRHIQSRFKNIEELEYQHVA